MWKESRGLRSRWACCMLYVCVVCVCERKRLLAVRFVARPAMTASHATPWQRLLAFQTIHRAHRKTITNATQQKSNIGSWSLSVDTAIKHTNTHTDGGSRVQVCGSVGTSRTRKPGVYCCCCYMHSSAHWTRFPSPFRSAIGSLFRAERKRKHFQHNVQLIYSTVGCAWCIRAAMRRTVLAAMPDNEWLDGGRSQFEYEKLERWKTTWWADLHFMQHTQHGTTDASHFQAKQKAISIIHPIGFGWFSPIPTSPLHTAPISASMNDKLLINFRIFRAVPTTGPIISRESISSSREFSFLIFKYYFDHPSLSRRRNLCMTRDQCYIHAHRHNWLQSRDENQKQLKTIELELAHVTATANNRVIGFSTTGRLVCLFVCLLSLLLVYGQRGNEIELAAAAAAAAAATTGTLSLYFGFCCCSPNQFRNRIPDRCVLRSVDHVIDSVVAITIPTEKKKIE